MHAQKLSRTKKDTNWTKYKLNEEVTHKSEKQENCPNYIKIPNPQMIEETKKNKILKRK